MVLLKSVGYRFGTRGYESKPGRRATKGDVRNSRWNEKTASNVNGGVWDQFMIVPAPTGRRFYELTLGITGLFGAKKTAKGFQM